MFLDSDNVLYGTTLNGGKSFKGNIYKLDQNYHYTSLHDFVDVTDGSYPFSTLVLDGEFFYGTTTFGGADGCDFSCGVIYKIDKTGNESVVHVFNNSEGLTPHAGLTVGSDGYLYGSTTSTIYKISTKGDFKVLSTPNLPLVGGTPETSFTLGLNQLLYGVTPLGLNFGSVFSIDNQGNININFQFNGVVNGQNPLGTLALAKDGTLYGTTQFGGDLSSSYRGCGTVFKISTNGQLSTIYKFNSFKTGCSPVTNLVIDSLGNLYGATALGGITSRKNSNGAGVVFKIDTNNQESIVYEFKGGVDGYTPVGNLVIDSNNNIYGITSGGGTDDLGTVYKLSID